MSWTEEERQDGGGVIAWLDGGRKAGLEAVSTSGDIDSWNIYVPGPEWKLFKGFSNESPPK